MALISINNLGVFVDVYRYRHLEDEQMVLDTEKQGLRTFSQWYHNNNDTMDFLPHNNDHREACTLLLSFILLHQKKADEYNLQVKCFANKVREIEDQLVNARVMQWIFDHNRHVWTAIQGSGAEDSYWGPGKPIPPLTKGARELPVLPPSP
jgi:hypothetical protein